MPLNDYTQWPDHLDVYKYLQASGLSINTTQPMFFDSAVFSAVQEWENVMRWHPFLSASAPSTRYFEILGGRVTLDSGLTRLDSVAINGSLYTLNTQVWPEPQNALLEARPYTSLRFNLSPFVPLEQDLISSDSLPYLGLGNGPRSLAVTGLWGFCQVLPVDVWQAVLRRAAMMGRQMIRETRAGGIAQVQSPDGAKVVFADTGATMTSAAEFFGPMRSTYRRLIAG